MKRAVSYIIMLALPIIISCGKASGGGDQPHGFKDDSFWQKGQWNLCIEEFRNHLDPNVRQDEMRTLDAAYVAILSADKAGVIPFTTADGVACEARIERGEDKAKATILRAGETIGIFTKDGDKYQGESTGIRLNANPLSFNSEEVHADIKLTSEGATLATLNADGPLDLVETTLDLPAGISMRGNIEARKLWETLRELTDAPTEEKATPLVEKAANDIHVKVYYEGDLSNPHGYVTMEPFHIQNRYDDYWTWTIVIRANNGTRLYLEADDPTVDFYNAWRSLMPHIIK